MREMMIGLAACVLAAAAAMLVMQQGGATAQNAAPTGSSSGAATPAADAKAAADQKPASDEGRRSSRQGGAPAPITVEVSQSLSQKRTSDARSVGTLVSEESVQIAPEIAGRVAEINFNEGRPIKEGDVIAKLDDALARAEVTDAQARFDLVEANFGRAETLSRSGNVTGRARDEATANFESGKATLELAKTRLDKHIIRAPFSGIVGLRNISPGAYMTVGSPIVNLERIDPLKVDFQLPETLLPAVDAGQKVEVTVDALPGKSFDGEIYAIDPQVDVNGRSLKLRARVPNSDNVLRPGLFARILIKGREAREVVTVPESAIVPRGGETFVYRIVDGRAVSAKVQLGERRDAEVEVVSGLKSGETIVVAGQQKLRDGAVVAIVETSEKIDVKGKG